jgi:vancomycin permeability regulator SanA
MLLKRLIVGIVAALFVAGLAIPLSGLHDTPAPADLIVVPGNTVELNGRPSRRLQARLDAALSAYRQGLAQRIFVSGGTGAEGYDEAKVMAQYLQRQGVPAGAIVIDSRGIDTAATARHASIYMQAAHLRSALVATQYFHVARMTLALRRNGVRVAGSVHPQFVEARDLYSIAREAPAYLKYMAQ